MNFAQFYLSAFGRYAEEINNSPFLSIIAEILLDNYAEIRWLPKELKAAHDFSGGGNATYIVAEGSEAILSHVYLDLPEVTINRNVLASLLEDFYNLAIKKTPEIYVIEDNGSFTVTDKAAPEIEEYLKNRKT